MKLPFLLIAALFASMAANDVPKSLQQIADSERKFSARCGQVGIRDSFLEYFTDDVVTFGPGLRRGKAYLQQQPPSAGGNGPKLQWEPVYGDVSRDGDLGYDTGPFVLTTPKGEHNGIFFSIWRKQTSGDYKVVLDAGTATPKPENAHPAFERAPQEGSGKVKKSDPKDAESSLKGAEARVTQEAASGGYGKAVLTQAGHLRLHRLGHLPTMDPKEIHDLLDKEAGQYKLELIETHVASSGDLGYTLGSYEAAAATSPEGDQGHYIHVWKKDDKGQWKLVLDSKNAEPKQ